MEKEINGDTLQKLVSEYGELQDRYTMAGGYEIEANIEKIVHGLNIQSLLTQSFSQLSGGEKLRLV